MIVMCYGAGLARAGLLARVEVAEEPVALQVEVLEGRGGGVGLGDLVLLLHGHLLQVGLGVRLGALLLGDGLGVTLF